MRFQLLDCYRAGPAKRKVTWSPCAVLFEELFVEWGCFLVNSKSLTGDTKSRREPGLPAQANSSTVLFESKYNPLAGWLNIAVILISSYILSVLLVKSQVGTLEFIGFVLFLVLLVGLAAIGFYGGLHRQPFILTNLGIYLQPDKLGLSAFFDLNYPEPVALLWNKINSITIRYVRYVGNRYERFARVIVDAGGQRYGYTFIDQTYQGAFSDSRFRGNIGSAFVEACRKAGQQGKIIDERKKPIFSIGGIDIKW